MTDRSQRPASTPSAGAADDPNDPAAWGDLFAQLRADRWETEPAGAGDVGATDAPHPGDRVVANGFPRHAAVPLPPAKRVTPDPEARPGADLPAAAQAGPEARDGAEARARTDSDVEPEPEPEPEFGLLDVVEAFTALRQEHRNQTREGRQLLQWVETAGRRLEDVSHKLSQLTAARKASEADETPGQREWVDVLVEIDLAMTRAVDATERALAAATDRAPAGSAGELRQVAAASAAAFGRLGWFRRRFARPLHEQFQAEIRRRLRDGQASALPDPTVEGLRMFVDRVRQLLSQQGIDRQDTLGRPFDPETMNAVEAVTTTDHAPGVVVRQLSPAYHWRGQPIRFADVCVARSP